MRYLRVGSVFDRREYVLLRCQNHVDRFESVSEQVHVVGSVNESSYVFLDRSHTSTASSLTQQNIVADFDDQQISKTGFYVDTSTDRLISNSVGGHILFLTRMSSSVEIHSPSTMTPSNLLTMRETPPSPSGSKRDDIQVPIRKKIAWVVEQIGFVQCPTLCPEYVSKYCSL